MPIDSGSVHIAGYYRDLYFSYMEEDAEYGHELIAPLIPVEKGTDYFYLMGKVQTANISTAPVGDFGSLPTIALDDSKVKYDAGIRGAIYEISEDMISENSTAADPREVAMMALRVFEKQQREVIMVERLKDTAIFNEATTLTGNNQWSDYTNSDPAAAIRTQCLERWYESGVKPNAFTCSYPVWIRLRSHPKIIAEVVSNVQTGMTRMPSHVKRQEFLDAFELKYMAVSDVQSELNSHGVFERMAVLHSTSMNPQMTSRRISACLPEKRDSYKMVERARPDRADVYNEIIEAKYDITNIDSKTAYVWKDAIAAITP